MTEQITQFLSDRVPDGWFTGPPSIQMDADEILCVGVLPKGVAAEDFRQATRPLRVQIAEQVATRFGRALSWGVEADDRTVLFTTQNLPLMTRLRLPERRVLDTLIEAGVARSRSEALSWCVKLVGRHEGDWLAELREALAEVEQVRSGGPVLI
jgi:hypothetical protein